MNNALQHTRSAIQRRRSEVSVTSRASGVGAPWCGNSLIEASERLDQEGCALAADAGQHERRLLVAAQGEPLAQLVGHDEDTPLLDGEPSDASLAERRAQLLLA